MNGSTQYPARFFYAKYETFDFVFHSFGSPFASKCKQFHETRLVRITHGGFAIWLNPFGMLGPQVGVNLLSKFGVGVDLVKHGDWLRATNEFHKRPFIWG
jgi:hypothetical protein